MRLAYFSVAVATDLHRLRSNTNENFFLVSKELTELKKVQDELISIQNHIWKIIDEQLDTFANNIHILRNCDQLLISRQQINFNYDSFSSLLSLAYANIKTQSSFVCISDELDDSCSNTFEETPSDVLSSKK